MARVELPYKVRIIGGAHGSPTRRRCGRVERVTNRYFATMDEAAKFSGNPNRVIYAPGEAWAYRPA